MSEYMVLRKADFARPDRKKASESGLRKNDMIPTPR